MRKSDRCHGCDRHRKWRVSTNPRPSLRRAALDGLLDVRRTVLRRPSLVMVLRPILRVARDVGSRFGSAIPFFPRGGKAAPRAARCDGCWPAIADQAAATASSAVARSAVSLRRSAVRARGRRGAQLKLTEMNATLDSFRISTVRTERRKKSPFALTRKRSGTLRTKAGCHSVSAEGSKSARRASTVIGREPLDEGQPMVCNRSSS